MKLLKTQKRAFTLVELIIVITILVILATLAFINVGEYITSSRDANRVTQIKEIYNGLNIHALAAVNYPKPEGSIEISGVSFQGYIGEEIIRKINISKLPIDPKDKTPYLYSINNTLTKAQLGIFLEKNNETFFSFQYPSKTYAEKINYSDRFLYTLGENVGVFVTQENIPIQETYTGTIDLTSNTGTFVVQFNNNTKNGSITGSGQDLLTNISIIQNACVLDGTIINGGNIITAYKRKNIGYLETCESTLRKCTNSVLNGDSEYKYTTCTASSPLDCEASDYSGYTIPTVPHSENKNIIKSVNYGTGSIDVSCNNGILSYGNENIICQNGYVLQGGSCIPDTCPGNAPNYSIANGTQSISGTWNHNIHGGVCTYICQAGYYNQTNSCTPASIGYIVPSEGQTTQNACNTDTQYQDTTGQSTCKTVTTGYYTIPIGAVPHTGETQCEANHYCVNGVKTACPVGTNSPAGSTTSAACTPNTYTVSGNFGANANGATINVCGINVTAQTDGTFSTTRNHNAVCNNITATRPGYTCTTSTQGPASLTDHFASVAGSCTLNTYTVSGNFGANANGATINVCGTNVTAQTDGTFSTTRNHNAVCNNITATRPGYTCTTSTQGPASLTDHFASVAGSCTLATKVVAAFYKSYSGKSYYFPSFTITYGVTTTKNSNSIPISKGTQRLTANFSLGSDGTTVSISYLGVGIACSYGYHFDFGACLADEARVPGA